MKTIRRSLVLLTVSALALTTITSVMADGEDDSWAASFEAYGWIGSWLGGGSAPEAEFEFDESGLKSISIEATDQHIEGELTAVLVCLEGDCETFGGNSFDKESVVGLSGYEMMLDVKSIELIPYTVPSSSGGKGLLAEVVSGDIIGEVSGAFLTGEGEGKTAGALSLGLEGTAAFTCFAPYPGPLDPCISGGGLLLPVDLDFVAEGEYAIDITEHAGGEPEDVVFELGSIALDMMLHVDLNEFAAHPESAIVSEGVVTVTDRVISFE